MRTRLNTLLLCMLAISTMATVPAHAVDSSLQKVVAGIYPSPSWKRLTLDWAREDNTDVKLTIEYNQGQPEDVVMGQTDFVARKILSWMVATHRTSGNKTVEVAVCGLLVGIKGITGKHLAASLGCTIYNANSDSLEWRPDF